MFQMTLDQAANFLRLHNARLYGEVFHVTCNKFERIAREQALLKSHISTALICRLRDQAKYS